MDGLAGVEVQANGPVLVALLVETNGGLTAIFMVEVRHFEATGCAEARARIEEELQDGAVAVVNDALARGQTNKLPGTRSGQSFGFVAGIAGLAGDKLGVRWVWHRDGKAQLGRGRGQVLVEAGEGRDAPVDGFGRSILFMEQVAEGLHIFDADLEQMERIVRPLPSHELYKRHHVFAVGALGVRRVSPLYPGFKNTGYG